MKYTGYFSGLLLLVAGVYCAKSFHQNFFMYWGYFLILLGFLRLIYTYHHVAAVKKDEVAELQIDEILNNNDENKES